MLLKLQEKRVLLSRIKDTVFSFIKQLDIQVYQDIHDTYDKTCDKSSPVADIWNPLFSPLTFL